MTRRKFLQGASIIAIALFCGGWNVHGIAPTIPGGLMSLTIADATPIDPVSGVGASGSGWVAIAKLAGVTSLVGTAVPSALTLVVSDPGFDASGNVTTVTRTITGVAHLRRQYPNGNSKIISTDGTNLTLSITLDDWIYSGTTIVSASIGSTFYPGCTASNASQTANSSTIAYTKPLFGWINPQQDICGSTYATESVAFHRHATAGRMVACIKYSANDGTTTSPTVTVAATALSSKITQGNIPEVWKATLDVSTLAQGVLANVNAKVYPWLGDSTAVLDLSVDGMAWPTSLPQTLLRVWNDRTGAYGGGYAYVKVGATGGTTSNVPATAAAAPYPTVNAAAVGLRAWNNTNRSHNDLGGGFIRLMDTGGANTTHSIASDIINAPGQTWCNIEKDPASSAVISWTYTSQSQGPSLLRFRNMSIVPNTTGYNILGQNGARDMVCLDNVVLDNTANKHVMGWYNLPYVYNCTAIGGNAVELNALPGATTNYPVIAGAVNSGAGTLLVGTGAAHVLVGCILTTAPNDHLSATGSTGDGDHGRIIYNNKLGPVALENLAGLTINSGLANIQNQVEYNPSATFGVGMNFFADSDLTTITNYIEFHNTAVGERSSRCYNDVVATKVAPNGIIKIAQSRFNIWDNYNCKTDTFNQNGAGSVGNWANIYSVGNVGNVSLFGRAARDSATLPVNDNTDSFLGCAWLPSSAPNLLNTPGLTEAQIMALFTNYTCQPQPSPAAGGNYVPINTASLLKGRVPAGKSILQYDLAGVLRKTDGTGAAGCYEAAP
jgi:hypothetical protein